MEKRTQIRSKKKKKVEAPPPISPPIDPSTFRNWAGLPEALLVCILDRFSFIPDLLTFAAVCRPWRSAAAATSFRGPPLLLTPAISPDFYKWSSPAGCRLQSLAGRNGPTYKCKVPARILRKISCIGCSHAQLILVGAVPARYAVIADVFTGREIETPHFPWTYTFNFGIFPLGILTAPLDSPSCLLLVGGGGTMFGPAVLFWQPGSDDEWSELELGTRHRFYYIISMVVFKGYVFGLCEDGEVLVFEFDLSRGATGWKSLIIPKVGSMYKFDHSFNSQLVECGGNLLLVAFLPEKEDGLFFGPARVGVYRLDWSKSVWVEMQSLGDWCLFIDAVRRRAFACPDPTRWGGRNSCIYFAGPGCHTWIVVPLDGNIINQSPDSPFSYSNITLSKWPSPIWVYPRLGGIQIEAKAAFSDPSVDATLQAYLDAFPTNWQERG